MLNDQLQCGNDRDLNTVRDALYDTMDLLPQDYIQLFGKDKELAAYIRYTYKSNVQMQLFSAIYTKTPRMSGFRGT